MHNLYKIIFVFAVLFAVLTAGYSNDNTTKITLTDSKIIEIIDSYDPDVLAAKLRAEGAADAVRGEEANYYPTLDAQAALVPPGSFPGSGSGTGVYGVMSSPYHKGQAYGLASSFTIYDFGRTANAVKAAKYNEKAKKFDISISRIGVLQTVSQIYREEILDILLIKNFEDEIKNLQFLEREISTFVSTGQRSIVDRYLIKLEVEKVRTELSSYREIENQTKKRLSLFLSLPVDSIVVPDEQQFPLQTEIVSIDPEKNPFLKKSREEMNYAKAKVDYAKSKIMPEIKAVGSYGDYEGARLVPKSNWSAVVGVDIPIFEGFKTDSEIKESKSILSSKIEDEKSVKRKVDEYNFKFDEAIESSRAKLKNLEEELKLSQEGYQIALARYNKFQGALLDLRETISNLYRVKNDIVRVRLIFDLNIFLKKIYNGYL